ncbi:hypothetical protein [Roseisolibacter agri]|uniref:Uncharacterized protein n=1 Tax=Roseisolibacter agri TaxID=2014610 RepID=A0AA37V8X7_9BACT|nr:hypothetical protein [Roseisolibacter agri]GLC28286.1 hypothetical protein rosag_47990 [Roseisolibacter agri]
MRRQQYTVPGDPAYMKRVLALYTESPAAAAVGAMAARLGLGEVRLTAISPYLTYLVDAPLGREVETLAAYASVALETTTTVLALETLPPSRRAQAWAAGRSVNLTGHPRGGA